MLRARTRGSHRVGRLRAQLHRLLLLHGHHDLLQTREHIEFETTNTLFRLVGNLDDALLQGLHLFPQGLHFARRIGRRGGTATARGPLNLLEKIAPTPLEVLVVKGDVLGRARIKVAVANGLGLHLAKAIEIELTREARELVVIKVLRDDLRGKEIRVLDDEHVSVGGPGGSLGERAGVVQ